MKDFVLVAIFIFGVQFLAVSIFCGGFFWWELYDEVSLSGISTGYEHCNSTNMTFVMLYTVCNLIVPFFWVWGECLTIHSENRMKADGGNGKLWQKALDEFERQHGGVPGIDRKPVHTAEWNEELKKWKKNKERQVKLRQGGILWRAIGFYVMYFTAVTAIMVFVLYASPQAPVVQEFWEPAYGLLEWEVTGIYGLIVLGLLAWELFVIFAVLLTVRWPKKGDSRKQDKESIPDQAAMLVSVNELSTVKLSYPPDNSGSPPIQSLP